MNEKWHTVVSCCAIFFISVLSAVGKSVWLSPLWTFIAVLIGGKKFYIIRTTLIHLCVGK